MEFNLTAIIETPKNASRHILMTTHAAFSMIHCIMRFCPSSACLFVIFNDIEGFCQAATAEFGAKPNNAEAVVYEAAHGKVEITQVKDFSNKLSILDDISEETTLYIPAEDKEFSENYVFAPLSVGDYTTLTDVLLKCGSSAYKLHCCGVLTDGPHKFAFVKHLKQRWFVNMTVGPQTVHKVIYRQSCGKFKTLLRRKSNALTFNTKTWAQMKLEMGEVSSDYWIGLEQMHSLTMNGTLAHRNEGKLWNDTLLQVTVDFIRVESEADFYRIQVGPINTDKFAKISCGIHGLHDGAFFTTIDTDKDTNDAYNCAVIYKQPGWHLNCHGLGLFGAYYNYPTALHLPGRAKGISWPTCVPTHNLTGNDPFYYSLKYFEAMLLMPGL